MPLYERCVRITNLFRMLTFKLKWKRMTEHLSENDVFESKQDTCCKQVKRVGYQVLCDTCSTGKRPKAGSTNFQHQELTALSSAEVIMSTKYQVVGIYPVTRHPKGREKENNLCRIICRYCGSCLPNISAECL